MKIVYLASTKADIEWMRRYYARVFPKAALLVREHFRACEKSLKANPLIGRSGKIAGVRELMITYTSFVFICRREPGQIEVLRVRNGWGEKF